MPDLFSDVRCSACGRPHNLRDAGDGRHPTGSLYAFTCPTTEQATTFRLPAPEPVILCPAGTISAHWVED